MTVDRPLVLVSNRGPVSFDVDEAGEPIARRGAGGLISGLGPLVAGTDTIWIAAAMTDGDRLLADRVTEAEGFRILLLASDPDEFRTHYDTVCNSALWFAHHGLWDPVYAPAWSDGWVEEAWGAYRSVNHRFAEAVTAHAPSDAIVLVQDYHLCLLAEPIREARPDLSVVHFTHTPFATRLHLRMLPEIVRSEIMEGLAAHHACGFHSPRWEQDFLACAAELGIVPPTFIAPLGPDRDDLAATASSEPFRDASADLDRMLGDRRFLVRVDRIELSKNILRGFDAYALLLERRPDLAGRLVMGSYVYPSRGGVPDYDRYRRRIDERVAEINHRHGTADWTPIVHDTDDDHPRSMAALARADVVLVNPIRDGLNLVAKEAMLLNERGAQLVLSPEAGVWEELGRSAWRADPFDLSSTADAIEAALAAPEDDRIRRHARLRDLVAARTPADWLADQIRAAGAADS